jgi:hypothetical protein
MDISVGSSSIRGRITAIGDPSVLIVDAHPGLPESLPLALTGALPEVSFDIFSSRDEGRSNLEAGRYHAVI